MKLLKRALAGILTACTVLTTCTACGENTATAMNIDGTDIPAGVYLYYVVTAYNDAMDVLREGGEAFTDCKTTKDVKKIMKKADINNEHADVWIQNKAVEYCQTYVAIQREFERLELTLSGEELAGIESGLASSKQFYGDFFRENGIGEDSVRSIITLSYQEDAIWEAYYGKDGSLEIQDQTLYDDYVANHLRVKYIEMPLKDGAGNLLKSDGKAEIEDMANDFLARLAKKSAKEADLMKEFDYLIQENANYVTSLSQAAVTTTDENGNTVTTATTAKVTTTEEKTTEETTTTPAAEETGTDETTLPAETTETTTTESTTTSAPEETTGTTTTGGTTTTTTTNALGYDTANEKILVVSTASSEAADPDPDETTTAPTYTPCKKVYEWAADENTPYNAPELIKDDECYYVVMKMDINDRMTENDLWTERQMETVRSDLYYEEFSDMLEDMGEKLNVSRNEKAFRRYTVLDVDVIAYQQAMMASYYSYYGNGS